MHWSVQIISCALAAFFFALLLNQPRKTMLFSALFAGLGYGIFLLLGQSTLGYFCATLFIGVACEICARLMKKISTLFITSALIPLVPGVGLYRTMRYLVQGEYHMAISCGTDTLMGICAIALGITISSVLFANIRKRERTVS
ncbi:MAG: threonine/serine exporter family protein [Clostridia bacterium]|nr:threonine/serine exporter family protein [Clostridia bacterium]